jgi:peptide/nickel transport system substrate-binding protein
MQSLVANRPQWFCRVIVFCALGLLMLGSVTVAWAQKQGGVLRLVALEDPVGFDTHTPKKASVYTQRTLSFTHNRLFEYPQGPGAKAGTVVPDLAESYSRPDATTYIIKLRQGVHFHNKPPVNGRELTAKDVKWTFDRMMAQSPEKRLFPTLKNIVVVDKYTVRFELSAPFSPFINNLAATTMVIYAEEAGKPSSSMAGGRDFTSWQTCIGTGPFILVDYQEGQKLVYRRNPNYFKKGLPYVDEIQRFIVRDSTAQIAALRTGKIDLIGAGPALDDLNVPEVRKIPGVSVLKVETFRTGENIIGRLDEKPWSDIRVRKAVSMAIDRDTWLKRVYPEGGVLVPGPVPSTSAFWLSLDELGTAAAAYRYDLDAARKLLVEAGYPNGFKTKLYTTVGYGPAYTTRTALIKDNLAKIGIEASIVAQEYPQWIKGTYKGNFHGLVHIPTWSLGDEDEWLGAYTPGNTRDHIHLDDPKVTALVLASRTAPTDEERARVIKEFVRLFHQQMYRAFLPIGYVIEAVNDQVQNYFPKMQGYDTGKSFETVWLK